jgi:hypothetical protein
MCMSLKTLQKCSNHKLPGHWGVLRAIHTLNTLKVISACLYGCGPYIQCVDAERKASCGVLEGHFCQQRPWLEMVVLVVVRHWKLTSDQSTVGIVKVVSGSIFLFPCRTHTVLTSDMAAKKRDLGESKLVI